MGLSMKRKFEVEEFYSKEAYRKFCQYRYWRGRWGMKIIWLVFIVVCVYEIVRNIVNGAASGSVNILLIVVLCIPLAVAVYLLLFGYVPAMRRVLKNSKDFFAKRRITFYDDYVTSSTDTGSHEVSYRNIAKVYETADSFYFVINKGAAMMVFKDSFTYGTPEELREFLNQKMNVEQGA